ncbi:MAG: efflux RND transporter periplasmic adaptor subunit, partial [Planctomycetota bacterium]
AALLAAAALFTLGCEGDVPAAAGTVTVERGRFEVGVSESCTFRPLNSWVVLSRASGQIDWIIEEGTVVKKGDLVFTQDRTGEKERLARDTNELEAARRNLKEVQHQVKMERDDIRLQEESAQSSVDLARTRLAERIAPPTPAQLTEAEAALSAAESAAKDKRAEAKASAELAANGFLSKAEAQAAEVASRIAGIEMERKKLALERLKTGASPQARKIAQLQLDRAVVNLNMKKADGQRRGAELDGRITDARSRVASLQRSVRRIQRSISSREVRAAGAGVIIYRNIHHRSKSKPEVGSRVWTGAGVTDIADTSRMKVRSQLAESHIRHLHVGSKVRVRPDPLPGVVLTARVIWIDRWSRDRSADLAKADRAKEGLSGVKVFALEAAVDESDSRIKPGFKGKVEFPLEMIEDALIVPAVALFGSVHERYVMLVENGRARRVPVTVRAEDARRAAVEGELTAGQQLLTRSAP